MDKELRRQNIAGVLQSVRTDDVHDILLKTIKRFDDNPTSDEAWKEWKENNPASYHRGMLDAVREGANLVKNGMGSVSAGDHATTLAAFAKLGTKDRDEEIDRKMEIIKKMRGEYGYGAFKKPIDVEAEVVPVDVGKNRLEE